MAEQNESEYPADLQQVELFGIPALFSSDRIPDEDVPAGLYRYDLRGSDCDTGRPAAIEKDAAVNHAGTVLSPIRIPYLGHGEYLNLGAGLRFEDGGLKSIEEFRDLWGGLDRYPGALETLHDRIIRENEDLVWAGRGDQARAVNENVYAVYQIRGEGVPYEFMDRDFLSAHGLSVKAADYSLVYGGLLQKGTTPDMLYVRFNTDPPEGYIGRSMSVSDVVVLNRVDALKAYYVDRVGFAPLPDFVRQRAELAEARERIGNFLRRAHGDAAEADPGGTARIRLAQATTEDGKYEVSVFADLAGCRLEKYLNENPGSRSGREEVSRRSFGSLRELTGRGLKDLDPAALTAVSEKERDLFERRRDLSCRKAVEEAIDAGYDPGSCRLDRTCCRAVVDEFGPDRTERVLAAAVSLKSGDGRFSPDTRAWAEERLRGRDRPVAEDCAVGSHPALLDGFIGFTREYLDEIRGVPEAPEPSL